MPRRAFLAVAAAASALQVVLSCRVFLFLDDYYFLGEARGSDLTWDYLSSTLFTHFSPVTRLANWVVVDAIAPHPWVVAAALGGLLTVVVFSATWLMVAIFDRTWVALCASALLGVSLTLVPLGNWWTAGANILPGMAGFLVAFASTVLVLRGGSGWWAVAALPAAAVGVLDYETPILLPGYLILWLVLAGHRVIGESWPALLRRTWWLWAGHFAVAGAAALNFRLNYYTPSPAPPMIDLARAMAHSLGGTLVPTAMGMHAPGTGWFTVASSVVGWGTTVLIVAWLLVSRRGAWRGLLFAASGWSLPTLALLLNRLERYGPGAADDAIYFYLPTVLTVIGLVEAGLAPRRRPRSARRRGTRAPTGVAGVLVVALGVALVGAYAWSIGPTTRYRTPPDADGDFVANARASAEEVRRNVGRFAVIDSLAHAAVMPEGYGMWSRDSNVLGITVPDLRFDDPDPPYYRFDDDGTLKPAPVEWLAQTQAVPTTRPGRLWITGADVTREDGRRCFTARQDTVVDWRFPPITGDDLVVRSLIEVDATSRMVLVVEAGTAGQLVTPYDIDTGEVTLEPAGAGALEIIESTTLSGVRLSQFTPGVEVCLLSLQAGQVSSEAQP